MALFGSLFARRKTRPSQARDLNRIADSLEVLERWAILSAAQEGFDLTAPMPAPSKDEPTITYTDQKKLADKELEEMLFSDLKSAEADMNDQEKAFFSGDFTDV